MLANKLSMIKYKHQVKKIKFTQVEITLDLFKGLFKFKE